MFDMGWLDARGGDFALQSCLGTGGILGHEEGVVLEGHTAARSRVLWASRDFHPATFAGAGTGHMPRNRDRATVEVGRSRQNVRKWRRRETLEPLTELRCGREWLTLRTRRIDLTGQEESAEGERGESGANHAGSR
jgi:hypothetical protein